MVYSTTMLSDAAICLKRYQYRWEEHLVKRPVQVGVALRRGIWLHRCLEMYHQGYPYQEEIRKMARWGLTHGVDKEQLKALVVECNEIMLGYIDYWAAEVRQHGAWKVLAAEDPVIFDVEGEEFRATIDLVIQDHRGIWIVEHKSTADIPPASWRAIDPQTALQFFGQLTARKAQPDGILFNYLWTKTPPVPRVKKNGEFYAPPSGDLVTTTRAFDRAVPEVSEKWQGTQEEYRDYLIAKRAAWVRDGAFYQRYHVFRPHDNVQETVLDVLDTVDAVRRSQERGHFRRSFHPLTCRKFCPYSNLCALEYTTGQPSEVTRMTEFMRDDGTRGEGR